MTQEIDILNRQMKSLRRQIQEQGEYIDTVSSPLWKRCWWWVGGYYFRKVGRFYPLESKRFKVWEKVARFIKCL